MGQTISLQICFCFLHIRVPTGLHETLLLLPAGYEPVWLLWLSPPTSYWLSFLRAASSQSSSDFLVPYHHLRQKVVTVYHQSPSAHYYIYILFYLTSVRSPFEAMQTGTKLGKSLNRKTLGTLYWVCSVNPAQRSRFACITPAHPFSPSKSRPFNHTLNILEGLNLR